jgi:glucose dehydrogenase
MSGKFFAFLLAAMTLLPAAASAQTKHVVVATIETNQVWQKAGLRLQGHGVLRFRADGQWVFNPRLAAVNGDGAQNLSTAGRTAYVFKGRQGREGQLIGRIGSGLPFVIGTHGMHKVGPRETGALAMMINDDVDAKYGAGLADNSGQLTVTAELAATHAKPRGPPCGPAIFGCPSDRHP